jgi:hypothetical protein
MLKIGDKIPAETASFRLTTVSAVREDWVVETIWTKLHAPHAVIEPVSETRARNGIYCGRDREVLFAGGLVSALD